MKKQYYWNIPDNLLNSLKQRKKLYNFYKNEQNKARELVENCQSVLFPELVALLNKIDERIKLLIFYQNLEDCELSEEEIITVIEREYFVTFYETIEEPTTEIISSHSMYYLLQQPTKEMLWDLDFSNMLKQGQLVDLMDYQKLTKCYQKLQNQAKNLIEKLNKETFYTFYSQLLLIDCQCKLLIEEALLKEESLMTVDECLTAIKQEIRKIHFEQFKYQHYLFEDLSLRYQV